jgi:NADH-quinone oxidoreductase subunit H
MGDPISAVAIWLRQLLTGWGLAPLPVAIIINLIAVVVIATSVLLIDIFLVWLERKIVARFQDRLGPNRLGPYGLIQPFADVIKLLIKEDITPDGASKVVFNLAPILSLASVILIWAVIPFQRNLVGSDINVGVLYIVAVGSIGTLAIIMAGWSSNNKYALLGAFRTVAQMIAYEVPMVIALMVPVILAGSMGVSDIVAAQNSWFILTAPVAALIFLITSIAEVGRAPFDLVEAESEIVAGFHIEYTGMKFGLFYAGELLHALTIGILFGVLFLGGWRGPGVDQIPLLGIFYLFFKGFVLYFVVAWIKYTFPRIRIDHMQSFNWKFLTPLALASVIVTALVVGVTNGKAAWVQPVTLFVTNLILAWGAMAMVSDYAGQERKRVSGPRAVASPGNSPASSSTPGATD